jgi:dihydroorotate dehydrogenase
MYRRLIRPILFLFDPEQIHHFTFGLLRFLFRIPGIPAFFRLMFGYQAPGLEREVFGLKFRNPLGLAAGFDKDALLLANWRLFGFGFVEFGTVTPRPQAGNPRKRLFRLPADHAVINRMGFNNAGADAMVKRLGRMEKGDLIVGINIGKNKDTPNELAAEDYRICFEKLYPFADYFVVNVSSPNTPGLRELQEKEPLRALLSGLQQLNLSKPKARPILLKIAPDLTDSQLDDIIEVVNSAGIAGIIATNTTIKRAGLSTSLEKVEQIGNGGLSGGPLTRRSSEVVRYLREKAGGSIPLIGVGGIMEAEDAGKRLADGAALVQVYTGFIYQGPGFARRILKQLSH